MANLTHLANHYRSDKGTTWSFGHKYTYLYDLLFWPYREAPIRFLELGLAVGGPETAAGRQERTVDSPSVAMWLDYFRLATVYGFDISDFSHIRHERFRFVQGDSGRVEDLQRLGETGERFEVIIDDASHASFHQQLALRVLWPRLAPGGLYVIEDLHWQSPVFEEQMPRVPLTRDFLTIWFEAGKYLPNPLFTAAEFMPISDEIDTFAAFPAFNVGSDPSQRLMDGSAKLIVMRKRAQT